MDPALPTTPITLWRSDAVVLFDWLMTIDLGSVPVAHPAERQALMDLLTRLEETDIVGVTQEQIDAAREEIAAERDWQPWQQITKPPLVAAGGGVSASYVAGDRIRYVAEPVFDLLVKPGDVGVVLRVEDGWVVVEWAETGAHSVPIASVRPDADG